MRVLLIGPMPKPVTGLSIANKTVFDYLPKYTKYNVNKIDTSYSYLDEDIGKFSFKKVFFYIKQYKDLYKIRRHDIIYMTLGQTFFGVLKYYPYFLIAKIFNKEIIIHIHGNHLWKEYQGLKGIKKIIFKNILQMSDKGIVLSSSLKKNLTPFLNDKDIYILENFVEDFLFDKIIEKQYDKLRIIYLSNLMEEKGIYDLLESLKIMEEKGISFEAKIAGDIDKNLLLKLESYFDDFKEKVRYLGVVYNEEKKSLLKWGNVFILPTKFDEGQPLSILEAMATGNIILTTKTGGIPDIFNEEYNGFYIEKENPNSIVKKLIMLDSNLEQYSHISKNNINEAKKKYTIKNFIAKLENIFNTKFIFQNLTKFRLEKNFRGRSGLFVQLWWAVDFFLFKPSPQILYGWRRFLLRLFGAEIGKGVIVRPSVTVTYPWKVKIGNYSWIGDEVVLYSLGDIDIGSNVVVSQRSYICCGSHDYTKLEFPMISSKIVIEDECWLATDVYVAPNVTIGKGTVVGARSSVFKNLPGGKVCTGSPAKVIKDRINE